MLFRWFIGLSMDAPVWDVTVFTKNRERLLEGDVARGFFRAVLSDRAVKQLLSMKSFRPKDGGGEPPGSGRNGDVTSMASSAATKRTLRPRTRMPGCIVRPAARQPGSATWGTC
jgi:hypothetical protein